MQSDGTVVPHLAPSYGGLGGQLPSGTKVVGMAASVDGNGYWLLTNAGTVAGFGDVVGTKNLQLGSTAVAIATDTCSGGYWVVGSNGNVVGVDAPGFGSASALAQHGGAVAIAGTQDGGGYWVAAADGTVMSFGDAAAPTVHISVSSPVVGLATGPATGGFWMTTSNGAVYSDGPVIYPSKGVGSAVVGIARAPSVTPQ
ncbi:MAG: hypothetical protein ACYDB3_01840 [Acidimicrobiales bacterium]